MFAHRTFHRAASSSARGRNFYTKSRPNAARPFAGSKPATAGSLPNVAPTFLRPSTALLLQAQQLLSTTPTLSFMTAAAGSSASGTPLSSVVEAGDADLEAILNGANGRVLVDFYAPWCSPCRVLAPILEQVAKDAGVLLVKVNVDEAQTAAQKYKVASLPTVLLIENGKTINSFIGSRSAAFVKGFVST